MNVDTSDVAAPPAIAPARRRLPGDGHMWVMIIGDLFIFGVYFVTYMVFRAMSRDSFVRSQHHLNNTVGVVNTLIMLTSSMTIALAAIAARERRLRSAQRLVWVTGALGGLFVLVKVFEWHEQIRNGHTVSDQFYSFYYVFTGVHLVHLLLGLIILGVVIRELRNPRKQRASIVEQGAIYWHMVDALWIVIFAILYLMR